LFVEDYKYSSAYFDKKVTSEWALGDALSGLTEAVGEEHRQGSKVETTISMLRNRIFKRIKYYLL
jgi:hypothetical protein